MSRRVNIELVDDLDGSQAEETVRFALDGTSYEIDLSRENALRLRDTFTMYVGAARKVSVRRRARNGSSA